MIGCSENHQQPKPCSARTILPPPTTAKQQYNLRRRPHDRQMPDHMGHLADKNFLIRILLKTLTSTYFVSICVLSYVNKDMID